MRWTFFTLFLATPVLADDAVVENVEARQSGAAWSFSVTLSHGDTGWDDYADGWRVVSEDGTELGMRVLHHPHVTEQPFTRSLSGVEVPNGLSTVYIEARTNVDGWGAARYPVSLK
ncbi:MAG: hypothetical protein QNJ20_01215 [Paracoccaceae bacterium]|nr:hypothetical protein [Paracoccaceae bacterium]